MQQVIRQINSWGWGLNVVQKDPRALYVLAKYLKAISEDLSNILRP